MSLLRNRLLRRTELTVLRLRRTIRLWLRHPILLLRHIPVLFHWGPLLLIHPRLRLEHRLRPIVFLGIVPTVLLPKWPEAFLVRLRTHILIDGRNWPRRCHGLYQRLFIQTSAS